MKKYIKMRLHRKETAKRFSYLKYVFKKTKEARRSCVDYWCIKITSKIYIKITSIFHPQELHLNSMSKSGGNSSILMYRQNFDINSTCWVYWYNRTKLVLVSTQNHRCFNVKFWCCVNVDKMTLFRRWNTAICLTLM